MSSIEMIETIDRKKLKTAMVHDTTDSLRLLHRWISTTAVACAFLSFGLWAGEMKSGTADAAVPAAVSETTEPAAGEMSVSDPTAATETTEPAAAATELPQAEVKTPDHLKDWKPPEMPEPTPFSSHKLDPEVVEELKERWGVELLGIRRTAAGIFLDFRFNVLDVDKALPLFDTRIKPHIVAERTNIKLPVPMAPKVGAFRPTNRGKNIKAGKTYFIMFGNPDRHVKTGEKVTVVIGDFKVEHLIVN